MAPLWQLDDTLLLMAMKKLCGGNMSIVQMQTYISSIKLRSLIVLDVKMLMKTEYGDMIPPKNIYLSLCAIIESGELDETLLILNRSRNMSTIEIATNFVTKQKEEANSSNVQAQNFVLEEAGETDPVFLDEPERKTPKKKTVSARSSVDTTGFKFRFAEERRDSEEIKKLKLTSPPFFSFFKSLAIQSKLEKCSFSSNFSFIFFNIETVAFDTLYPLLFHPNFKLNSKTIIIVEVPSSNKKTKMLYLPLGKDWDCFRTVGPTRMNSDSGPQLLYFLIGHTNVENEDLLFELPSKIGWFGKMDNLLLRLQKKKTYYDSSICSPISFWGELFFSIYSNPTFVESQMKVSFLDFSPMLLFKQTALCCLLDSEGYSLEIASRISLTTVFPDDLFHRKFSLSWYEAVHAVLPMTGVSALQDAMPLLLFSVRSSSPRVPAKKRPVEPIALSPANNKKQKKDKFLLQSSEEENDQDDQNNNGDEEEDEDSY